MKLLTEKDVIFKTGEIVYDDEWYKLNNLPKKPVLYTESFLKDIAKSTLGSSLELTHGDVKTDVIGHLTDFEFVDDKLLATVDSVHDKTGKGFSPEFKVNFRDKGDKYEAIDGSLLRTVLTDKPRSHVLCNGIDNGGNNMSDTENETIKILNAQIKDLNKQVAQKDAIIEANKKKLDEYDELVGKVDQLEKENADFKSQIDGLKPQAEAYSKIENEYKTELLNKAFGDDENMKKSFADSPIEKLEKLAEHRETTRLAHGVGAGASEGSGEGGDEPSVADKALEFYKKTHNGEEPSFIKTE